VCFCPGKLDFKVPTWGKILLNYEETRKGFDFLLAYLETAILSLLLGSWIPYYKLVGKLNV